MTTKALEAWIEENSHNGILDFVSKKLSFKTQAIPVANLRAAIQSGELPVYDPSKYALADRESEIVVHGQKYRDMHRRMQQAEAAVAKFKKQWDENGGPSGGNFGRALLATECARLAALLEKHGIDAYSQSWKIEDAE